MAIRPWIILPFLLLILRRQCRLPIYGFLLQPISCLIGAVIMAAILSLPLLRPSWISHPVDFVFLIVVGVAVYGLFLYSFSRSQLKAAFPGVLLNRRAVQR